eukprot:gene1196-1509_t
MGSSLNKPLADSPDAHSSSSNLLLDATWRNLNNDDGNGHHVYSVTHRRRHHKLSPLDKQRMKNIQSLNFTVNDNLLLRSETEKTTKGTFFYYCLFVFGIVVGCIAYGIKMTVAHLQGLKFHLVNQSGPLASSSGIPEIKGYLNGVKVPNSLGFKSLFGKVVSLIMSYSSGLFLGPEGPMIHIGSAVGAAISQFRSSTLDFYPKLFLPYQNDHDKRDFISMGAAAGISAAFGAPIGGVLFSIEEASSFWSRQLTWRTFFCCMIATFTANFLLQGFGMSPDMQDAGLLTFGFSRLYLYRYSELLCFCILGVIGGLFGAVFVFFNVHLNKWRKEFLKQNSYLRLLEVLFLKIGSSSNNNYINKPSVCEDQTNAEMTQFFCPPGMYSEMASLLFVNPDQALRRLYSRTINTFTLPPLLVFTLFYLILSILASGLWVAGGLFVPMMMVGAGFGRFTGQLVGMWFTGIDSSIYALVGTSAMMAGYCRMTIALVVIMVELTEDTQYLVPIIIAVMIAKWVGDFFNESVYEHLMELKYIPFLQSLPPHALANLRVPEVMNKSVVVIPEICSVQLLISTLNSNNHHGFPVVFTGESGNRRLFRGLILRHHILVLLKHKVFYRGTTGQEIYLDDNLTHTKFKEETSKKPPLLSELHFTHQDLERSIDLRPYMNSSGITIHDTFSFSEAYKLFRTMGLRHLPVVDINNEVVGIITRKDLL